MPKGDFNKVAMQSHFLDITLWHGCSPVICCIFSEHPFLKTPLEGCICIVKLSFNNNVSHLFRSNADQ